MTQRLAVLTAAVLGCGPAGGARSDAAQAALPDPAAGHHATRAAATTPRGSDAARVSELQRAVDRTVPGDTLVVHGGHYRGALRLHRPVTLLGRGEPILDGEWTGDVVTITAPGVTLEGFRIRQSGLDLARNDAAVKVRSDGARIVRNRIGYSLHGVYLEGATGTLVEGNEIAGFDSLATPDRGNAIHLWNARENLIRANVVHDSRDGLYFAGSPTNRILDNDVQRTRIGLHYMYSDSNVFSGNVFRDNEAGAAIMLSRGLDVRANRFLENVGHRAYGLLLQTADDSRVVGNEIAGNTVGLFLDNSNRNEFSGNAISGNFLALHLYASAEGNRFTGNVFLANEHDLVNDGGRDENVWSPGGRGNYWEEHPAYDLDADGLADTPHRIGDRLATLARDAPSATLFTRSPALDALALAERLFPAFESTLPVDEHPLVRPGSAMGARRRGDATRGRRAVPFVAASLAAMIAAGWALGRLRGRAA